MINPYFSYVGSIIKKVRLNLNLTQEELAERIGRTARYIMAIENEERGVSLDTLIKLIRTLNISADTIAYPERNIIDSKDEQLIRLIQRLNSRDKTSSEPLHRKCWTENSRGHLRRVALYCSFSAVKYFFR